MGSSRCYSLLSGCPPRYGLIAVLLSPLWVFSSSRPLRCSRHLCGCPPSQWARCGALLASVGALVFMGTLRRASRLGGGPRLLIVVLLSPRWGPPRHGQFSVLFSLWWLPSSSWAHCGALLASLGPSSPWASGGAPLALVVALLFMGSSRCSSHLSRRPSSSWAHYGASLASVGPI